MFCYVVSCHVMSYLFPNVTLHYVGQVSDNTRHLSRNKTTGEPYLLPAAQIRRVILCSGAVYYQLSHARQCKAGQIKRSPDQERLIGYSMTENSLVCFVIWGESGDVFTTCWQDTQYTCTMTRAKTPT